MINLDENPIIAHVVKRNTCSSIYITNYEKCSTGFLANLNAKSFIINTISCYPDLVCVIPNDKLDEFVQEFQKVGQYVKIERAW